MWWFGGGFDLTPYYPVREDVLHWHRMAREACAGIPGGYEKYKAWCDRYFFLPHRNETRGVGGLFFDDLNAPSFEACFAFARAVGDAFPRAWLPIAERRRGNRRSASASARSSCCGAGAMSSSTSSTTAARSSACRPAGAPNPS